MNLSQHIDAQPPVDPTELRMEETWDTEGLIQLVRRNSARGYMPSLLLLGRKELAMLRRHLAAAFGKEEVERLPELYYAGLRVVETQCESLVKVAGEKMLPAFERASRLLPVWKDEGRTSRWRFDAGVG